MLIICPDCGKSVSDKAPSCPNCGRPIHNIPTTVRVLPTPRVQTVEQTGKKYKGQIIAANILLAMSCCCSVAFFSLNSRNISSNSANVISQASSVGSILFLLSALGVIISLVWIIITRLLIWWHHR